ncbi:ATP-binding cassette domain-containing protein [Kitasatospora sp. CM 4170]|uniref:ATP-binding cassette domain-containing protein n=1 Tax=Kitasatospora aburaviensis TaxID=67265 RepID=A0ABW1F4P6_9ACTN|nr:ATP-binding cassette domain-containing protein [Kitasatospora sp. CM 4170]WNM47952.1 ATP-binding cassette domain-containing protein [Kitasatospora sp. CM 4170]
MIQITGLTKVYRRGTPPAVLDLTFDARAGAVTALLGPEDAGKSTALRLMLGLERGQGVALFDGRPYWRLRRPEREVGVLLAGPGGSGAASAAGVVAGHPGRRAQNHLRMLAAAVGVPTRRADELLEQTRLAAVGDQRLRTFSPGMHRRLALAAALLGDPGTLVLDAPTDGLSPRNAEWFHSFLRSFGAAGGTVLVTTRAPKEAAELADRVITLDRGRLVADQPVAEFRRTRLSPEVAVRGPQMARLADLLVGQGAQVRRDGGAGIAVAGIGRTEIGELAYRNGILLHELADRVVEQPAPRATLPVASGRSGRVRVQPSRADSVPAGTVPGDSVPAGTVPGGSVPVEPRSAGAVLSGQRSAAPEPRSSARSDAEPEPRRRPKPGDAPAAGTGPASDGSASTRPVAARTAGAEPSAGRPATGVLPVAGAQTRPGPAGPAEPQGAASAQQMPRPAAEAPSTPPPTGGGVLPALALPATAAAAAAASGTSSTSAAAATTATSPGVGATRPAPPESDLFDETKPTVAVDRLFRDGLSSLAWSEAGDGSDDGNDRGDAAPAAGATDWREDAVAGDLMTADTVRLGRLTLPTEATAPTSTAPTSTAPTTPDHRSE